MSQPTAISAARNVIFCKAKLAATIVKEKPGMYASYCPALNLCSQGRTPKEAARNIIEATSLFIEDCIDRGVLTQVLKDCGFRSMHTTPKRTTIRRTPVRTTNNAKHITIRRTPVRTTSNAKHITIPAELPMMAY